MSKDLSTSGPSRRSIAKGAAWAVPAVSIAAAAPALAASPCSPGAATVTINCPDLVGVIPHYEDSLSVTIGNPASNSCDIPMGTQFTVDRGGLADVQVAPLNELNVGVAVIFDLSGVGHLTAPLAPGESVTFQVFPNNLATVAVGETLTVSIDGTTASASYIIVSALGLLSLAVCG